MMHYIQACVSENPVLSQSTIIALSFQFGIKQFATEGLLWHNRTIY
jgi:hypothetical protein